MAQRVERLRGRAGQRQRARRLRRTNGLCERCQAEGRTALAVVVDHIKPLALGGSDEDSNTRNLCRDCHLEVTAEQFGHAQIAGRAGVTTTGRPTFRNHAWNLNGPGGGSNPGGPSPRTPSRSFVCGGRGLKVKSSGPDDG